MKKYLLNLTKFHKGGIKSNVLLNFKTALLLAAMTIFSATFYSCSKENDKEPVTPTPENTETPKTNEVSVEEISTSIKTLADAATEGKPVQLVMDANITAQDVSSIAQALQQNSDVKVDLDLSKTEIVSLPAGAFKETKNLTSVTLPSKVAEISDNAFKGCTTLKSVTIKPTLAKSGTTIKIGASAFENCTALDSVLVSKADIETVEIDPTAFVGTKISLLTDNKFTSFEDVKTFCPKSVLILAHVTEIPAKAFYKEFPCQKTDANEEDDDPCYDSILVSVKFAEGIKLTQIADSAFKGCKNLENLTIPNGVKTIGADVFWCCSKWKNPSVPEGVEEIGEYAFCQVNMGNGFEIPSSVKVLGYEAFWWHDNGTYSFSDLHFSVMLNNGRATVTKLPIEDNIIKIPNTWAEIPLRIGWCGDINNIKGVEFEKNSSVKKLISYQFVALDLDEVEIPASVTELDSLVFCGTWSVRKVTFEKGSKIEKIDPRAFGGVRWGAAFPEEIHLPIYCELAQTYSDITDPISTTIYVPSNLVDKFKAAECYKNCEIIAEED
ncbi:MAG: leucine-rich repeat domain-containing protein [Bacteroidales bacterium]|nr:leucine-rich repeat domain-containing protein [Bacteroidales bacterium]